ncbi:MAG: histone deacetylase, partial [Actinomycetota bacterium]|nr:histone deacetylase [Actinomycetota bacterium]
ATGALSVREVRGLGLPWSPELVERGRRSVGGTLAAARDALEHGHGMNLGGGTHHASHDAGRGYCLFNDVAVVHRVLGTRTLVVDCDVHQGDGTAELLQPDPSAFTLSVHAAANYPFHRATSDLDVDLPTGTGDDEYLSRLSTALTIALSRFTPTLVVYLAGADPWEGDALGRLSLSKAGLRERDALVLDTATRLGVPICVTLAGGYAPDVTDTVDVNLATASLVVARAGDCASGLREKIHASRTSSERATSQS